MPIRAWVCASTVQPPGTELSGFGEAMFKLPNGCDFLTEQQASLLGGYCHGRWIGLFPAPRGFEDKTHLLACSSPSAMWILGCPSFQGMKIFPCCRTGRQLEDDTVGSTSTELALRSRVPSQGRQEHTWTLVSQTISEMGPC